MESWKCAVCDKAGLYHCAICKSVYYCSKDHQRQHWAEHKADCRPFKIATDSAVGRHLVATREIKAGQEILREQPLLRGPSENSDRVCVSCFKTLSSPEDGEPCQLNCGWYLCHEGACHDSKEHKLECEWGSFLKLPVKKDVVFPSSQNCLILVLRLLLTRLHKPKVWSRLSTLETHTASRLQTIKFQEHDKAIAQSILETYDLKDVFSEDQILDMIGIIEVNAFYAGDFLALYDLSSMIEHNCFPNAKKIIAKDGEITIKALGHINKGDHISITYVNTLWGTTRRFTQLLKTKHFSCVCVRCTDNTEIGTYFSAVLCQKRGCFGPMLPESLCELAPTTPWTCEQCGATTPNLTVKLLLKRIQFDFDRLDIENYSQLLTYLETWGSKLHRNHYLLLHPKNALVALLHSRYPKRTGGRTDAYYNMKVELSTLLYNLQSRLAPGFVE